MLNFWVEITVNEGRRKTPIATGGKDLTIEIRQRNEGESDLAYKIRQTTNEAEDTVTTRVFHDGVCIHSYTTKR